ncbi:MAG: hypothetical protein L3J42_05775 [Hydrogenimonas sp.]|nr:hypothetical protein [Hydrogenimonas sp.]
MKMNHIAKFAAAAVFVFGTTAAMAVITGSKHDLSATGGGTIKANAGQNNDEICVYCHTPHAANVDFSGAPLWNKSTPTSSFRMYGATTAGVAGQTIAGTATDAAPNAPSLACLSCHDGVSAINSIVNAPGSGGYTAGGANVAFGAAAAGTAVTMPAGVTQIGDGDPAGVGLNNDHPVSITYVEGAASLKPVTTTITGWSGATTISDLLRNGKVECGSCHDPHLGESDTFLRRNKATVGENSNAGSRVCLTCHDK